MRAVRAASRPSQHPWTRRGRRRDRPPPPTTREGHTPDGEVGELPKDATIRGIGRERSATTFQNYHEAVAKGGLEASARREDGADHGGVLPGRRRVCAMGAGAGGLWAYDRCECGEEAGARRVFGGGKGPQPQIPSPGPTLRRTDGADEAIAFNCAAHGQATRCNAGEREMGGKYFESIVDR